MKLDKISERVYTNTDGLSGGNVGIIILENRVLVVDSQYPVSGADFRRSIGDITKKRVSHLLLTHVHGDHIFGAQAFDDTNIVSHARVKEKMEENLKTIWTKEGLEKMVEDAKKTQPERAYLYDGVRIVLPTSTFKRSLKIGDISIVHTGGHTDCSSYVYVADDKVLFAGDNLFVGRFPWAGDLTVDPDKWIHALQKYLKMDIQVIVPGHGLICDKKEVEKQLKWFRFIRRRMRKLITEGASEDEVVKQSFSELYPSNYPERVENSYRAWFRHWKS